MILYYALAFFLTLMITPQVAHFMKTHHITGKDIHKPLQPDIPEMGGLSYVFSLTLVFSLGFVLLHEVKILAALSVFLLSALIGAYDDLRKISQKKKLFLTLFSGVPLLFFVEETTIDLFSCSPDLSWGYYLLVLLAVSACSNATNLLAGFNGEEAGLGAIAAFSLGVSCLLLGKALPQFFLFALFSALLAFLLFNRYPAHVFPGDTGTLPIGALIAASVILGKVELLGFLALLLPIFEFFLKMRVWFKGKEYGPTRVVRGRLYPPPYASVANLLTRALPLTEKALVILLWALGGLCGLISVVTAYLLR